jgi:NCAIR mutase (PurE)-related protein
MTDTRDDAIEDLGFAKLDHDRARRRGFPEVIFGEGKLPEQIAEAMAALAARNPNVLCTRTTPEAWAETQRRLPPDALAAAEWDPIARTIRVFRDRTKRGLGTITIVTAGTSDQFPARECLVTAETLGNEVDLVVDVGVAGLHRLLREVERIRRGRVVVVVAGMDAALPSVVSGLVDRPVIAVPTSVGYGASFGGIAALLSSLNACSSGVTCVNIDNGFGGAYAAAMMNRP